MMDDGERTPPSPLVAARKGHTNTPSLLRTFFERQNYARVPQRSAPLAPRADD
jgi:hypothetical protein